jgi:DNA-binding PadR family transcriptional regulator
VVVRGLKVLLDQDLATLYEVETRALLQAVRRNPDRFPSDFMFELTQNEVETLRSQNVIARAGRGGRRSAPYAFTEQGVAMLSSVLRSKRAVAVNVEIMRAFVRLREALESRENFARKLDDLERKSFQHDAALRDVFAAIKQLMTPPAPPKRAIGFAAPEEPERA